MGLYDTFSTDANLEKEGVWLDYDSFRVKVGYAGPTNKRYQSYSEKKLKPIRRAMEAGTIDSDRSMMVMVDIYAEVIILDWVTRVGEDWIRGIEPKGGGDLLEVNKANIVMTLKALPALFLDIKAQSDSIATFRAADMEEDSKNS